TVTTATYNAIKRVAIVDDSHDQAETIKIVVKDAGYEPVIVDNLIVDPTTLLKELMQYDAVVCDHRLYKAGWLIYGSRIVAELYQQKKPAILQTQFLMEDHDVTIREFRRYIPVVLRKT